MPTFSGFDLVPLGSGGGETFGDVTGDLDDRVRVVLNGEDILVAETYEVQQSILTQPSHFTLRFGWGDVLKGLIAKAQPNTPFQLFVGNTPRFTGQIDGYEASGDGSGGGVLTLHGRDNLAPIHDAFITKEESFDNATYAQMADQAISEVSADYVIYYSNDANRKLTTGIGVKPTAASGADPQENTTGPTAKQLRTRIGERMYEFLKREFDRAGLFLWAAGDGSLIVSAPNGNQVPFFRIVRQRGLTRNAVNVVSFQHRNATEGRYSEATVYARGGGKKYGRTKLHGSFVDTEMQGYGIQRPLVLRDANVTNAEQAEFYARRKLAETRRAGWSLVYTVAGHTIPSLATGARAVWAPDTVVDVRDDELGLSGSYYLERVVFRRNPQTTTELTLMRPEDLVFATGESGS
jgi:prophage tail gpP-like protein